MDKHEPGVGNVERSSFDGVPRDVVPPDLEIGRPNLVEKASVDVGSDHTASGADTLTHPLSDRAGTAADFQAASAGHHIWLQLPNADRVVERLEGAEAVARLGMRVVEDVV